MSIGRELRKQNAVLLDDGRRLGEITLLADVLAYLGDHPKKNDPIVVALIGDLQAGKHVGAKEKADKAKP